MLTLAQRAERAPLKVERLAANEIRLYENGGQGRNRTTDTRIFSPLLYQLSYLAAGGRARIRPACQNSVKQASR